MKNGYRTERHLGVIGVLPPMRWEGAIVHIIFGILRSEESFSEAISDSLTCPL
jgi:hypothetical protein